MQENFKNLISSENGKFVMIENGEPRFVVMPWREFEAMRGNPIRDYISNRASASVRVRFAEAADEAIDVPAYIPVRRSFAKLAVDTEKIRLEDLPV